MKLIIDILIHRLSLGGGIVVSISPMVVRAPTVDLLIHRLLSEIIDQLVYYL